jgi:hypothetical protein
MAEFHLWSKDSLVRFAEEATAKLEAQSREIVQLQDDFKTVQLAWRNALQEATAKATLPK